MRKPPKSLTKLQSWMLVGSEGRKKVGRGRERGGCCVGGAEADVEGGGCMPDCPAVDKDEESKVEELRRRG